jgi:hypothetical protein
MRISLLMFPNKKWTRNSSQRMMTNTPTDLLTAMRNTIRTQTIQTSISIPTTTNNNNLKNKNTPIKNL